MPNGIGKQLMGGVISKYVGEGGRMSGALGILDNIIKERERTRTEQTDITKSLLGVKEVARGVAQKRGLPFVESEEDIQQKTIRDITITKGRQDIAGTSIPDARDQAWKVLQYLRTNPGIVRATQIDREAYIENAKTGLFGAWSVLPPLDQQQFEEAIGDVWDRSNPGKKKVTTIKEKVTQPQPKTTSRYKVTPMSQ